MDNGTPQVVASAVGYRHYDAIITGLRTTTGGTEAISEPIAPNGAPDPTFRLGPTGRYKP